MRILCLNLQREAESSFAENFLQLSPLLQLRKPGFIFADITGTSHLFGGEKQLLHQALKLARQSYPEVRAAIAGSPASAQVFAQWQTPSAIIPPGQARTSLLALPLTALCDLEGLVPWISLKEIKSIISFFESLALDSISQLTPLRVEAWRERWGKTGEILWRKIHGLEKQIISPFIPSAILVEFIHLDWPLTSLNSLLEYLQEGLRRLCLRLEGRSEQARIVNIHLHCEYSQQSYRVKIQLQQGSREVHLLLKLLENKLALLQLDNPIRSIEIEIVPCSERILQLDFFSPRAHDSNRLNQLFSLFRQNSIEIGFFQLSDSLMLEDSWSIYTEFSDFTPFSPVKDEIDFGKKLNKVTTPKIKHSYFRLKPAYSQHIPQSPRPNRILKFPQKISISKIRNFAFARSFPTERLEQSWWKSPKKRDYYWAISPRGQVVWIYHDLLENRYYIHGYLD